MQPEITNTGQLELHELRRVNELLSCTGRSQKEAKQRTVSMVICSITFYYTVYWERGTDS